jgi:hypothetical protein
MLSRIAERIVAILDWCWPFPLGAFAAALVFSVSAVIWIASRHASSPSQPSPQADIHSAASSPPRQEELPAPSLSATPPQPDSSVAKDHHPSGSVLGDTSRAGTLFRPDSANRIPVPEPRTHSAEISTAREVASSTRTAAAHPQAKRQIVKTETKVASPVSRLSPAQESELRDRLTLGRFFMERKDYPAAMAQFQAALAIDPSNREAKAAMQQAHDASKSVESSPRP